MVKNEEPMAFVIMPFDPGFDEIYRHMISQALASAGYKVVRTDDLLHQRSILHDIVSFIIDASLIVADLTGANPNVFYELGIAHALRKPVILLTQELADIPFDLRSYRVIVYDTHFARVQAAHDKIMELARQAIAGNALFGNPVTDFLLTTGHEELNRTLVGAESQELSQVEPTSLASDDEEGFLDHMVNIEEGYGELASIMEEVTESIETIGQGATSTSQKIEQARLTAGNSKASAARLLSVQYSKKMEEFYQNLSAANDLYENVEARVASSLEKALAFREISSPEDREGLETMIRSLTSAREAAIGAIQNIAGMREAMRGIEGMERNLRRATQRAGVEVDRLISNITKTISSAERGIEIAQRKLIGTAS